MRRVLICLALWCVALDAHALKNTLPEGVDLRGIWVMNAQASDDGEAMLAKRMKELAEQARRDEARWRKRIEKDPYAWMPEFSPPERTPQFIAAMAERDRNRRRMLGLTNRLEIDHDDRGGKLTLTTDFETRRYDAGERTQVSLPQGPLADSRSGWDGEWFVIRRDARRGPRITEKFRILRKTGQLEMQVAIKGDSILSGLKVRRVFDRAPAAAQLKPSAEVMGPVR